MADKVDNDILDQHWQKTRTLLTITLVIWAFFALVMQFFVGVLNEISIAGFPLGYYFAAQGAELAFVILIFWFAKSQSKIDEEFGLAEEGGDDE